MKLAETKTKAEQLLKTFLVETPPVPILELVEGHGLVVRPAQFDEYTSEVAGYLDLAAKTLFINQIDSPSRQAVTMGYALGLLKLHEAEVASNPDARVCYRSPLVDQLDNPIAADAFCFASFVLIPENALEYYQDKEFVSATSLARIFGVTNELLQYRQSLAEGENKL